MYSVSHMHIKVGRRRNIILCPPVQGPGRMAVFVLSLYTTTRESQPKITTRMIRVPETLKSQQAWKQWEENVSSPACKGLFLLLLLICLFLPNYYEYNSVSLRVQNTS